MIPIPNGVRVWIATGHTDMRRGMRSLALTVQESLKRDPHAGDLYIFRGRSAQHATFCIQSSKRDNCISVASAFWTDASSRTVPTRQGFEVHLHR
ncbi:IS66 family insertion sequence element accessory protein TnpB, partial [Bradyrhizobium sp. AS23.2]|uniref:IS66 family insertion sequence element accessory protein TnpB n=1 Tax=Bradyrhizobium sp. AS23.2 TaxID=1680155 RepID=UPI001160FB8F